MQVEEPSYGFDGRVKRIKDINGSPASYRVSGFVADPQGDNKRLCIQRLEHITPVERTEYRFAYYMIGVKPGAKGRWVFGQYAPMIPAANLLRLLASAAREWPEFRSLLVATID